MLFILMTAVQIKAQDVVVDKVEENGCRFVITNKAFSGFQKIYIGMGSYYVKTDQLDSTVYNLDILFRTNSNSITIAKGRKLLLKLSNETIIILENTEQINVGDYEFDVVQLTAGSTLTMYEYLPSYQLTQEQLNQICNDEVVKIRLEYDTDEYTIEETKRKKNKFSTAVRTAYDNIQKAYSKQKNIYSDF